MVVDEEGDGVAEEGDGDVVEAVVSLCTWRMSWSTPETRGRPASRGVTAVRPMSCPWGTCTVSSADLPLGLAILRGLGDWE